VTRKLLILDLDETLIFASESPLDRQADFKAGQYSVYLRPGVQEFLASCREHFDVAVWTSSTESYAANVVTNVFGAEYPLKFVWSRNRCSRVFQAELQEHGPLKDLAKVRRQGYDLQQVLVVDDSPEKLARSYGNLVQIRPYLGDPEDRELHLLMPYLLELKPAPNVRVIEKRGWRSRLPTEADFPQ
jgi:TFIIF-interacting CTD phosphatase-like protein